MNKSKLSLFVILIITNLIIFPLAFFAEKTIEQKISDLEKTLLTVSAEEKVDTLNKIAAAYINISADRCIQYGTQSLKLAQELEYTNGEAWAYNYIGIGSTILGKPDVGQEYFEKALEVFKKIGDKKGISTILNNLGSLNRRLSDFEKALEFYLMALEIEKEIGTKSGLARVLNNLGNVYGSLSNYDKSLAYHLEALNIREELGEKNNFADSLHAIGLLYIELGKTNKGLEYLEKAMNIFKEAGNKQGYCDSLMVIGVAYNELKNYDRALSIFQETLAITEELQDKRGICYAFGNIGSVYENLKDYPKALEYFYKALKIETEIGDRRKMALTFIALGNSYLQLRDFDRALENLGQAVKIGTEINVKGLLKMSYEKLSQLYAAKNDNKKALEYYQLFHRTDKEILDEKSNNRINELQEKYEAEKRSREIDVLKKNNEIQHLRFSRERITRNALIIGFILVMIIAVLLFKKYLYLFAFWKKQKYIGHFRLMEKLGSGAMGSIYLAHNLMDKSDIAAVKVLRDELFGDDNSKKRFKREAAIIDKLRHPNIIKIFEIGVSGEKLFIAMEFLDGRTLEDKINEEGQLKFRESIHIMVQISDAIAFIHSKNIIHRDLKPANIMIIKKNDDANFVKLLDFGLAKMELESRLTQSGNFLGTLQYLAPEQVLDAHSVPANDIFSMGVTFYRMLTGQVPFAGETVIDIMRQIIGKTPVEIAEIRPEITGALNELVMQMINKNPQHRPSAESVHRRLKQLTVL